MIETIENAFQGGVVGVCTLIALATALKKRDRSWAMLFFFYADYLFGNLFWQICLLYFGKTPRITIVSDLSWYAAFLFLYLLMKMEGDKLERRTVGIGKIAPYAAFLFSFGMAVFFMQIGGYVSNLIYAVFAGLMIYQALNGLFLSENIRQKRRLSFLCTVALLFMIFEYGSSVASCFWNSPVAKNLYYVSDLLMTLTFPLFMLALKREVES